MQRRMLAEAFRSVPAVEAAVLRVPRREPTVLPVILADRFSEFLRGHWAFSDDGPTKKRTRAKGRRWPLGCRNTWRYFRYRSLGKVDEGCRGSLRQDDRVGPSSTPTNE
jgi:hypothetical protein